MWVRLWPWVKKNDEAWTCVCWAHSLQEYPLMNLNVSYESVFVILNQRKYSASSNWYFLACFYIMSVFWIFWFVTLLDGISQWMWNLPNQNSFFCTWKDEAVWDSHGKVHGFKSQLIYEERPSLIIKIICNGLEFLTVYESSWQTRTMLRVLVCQNHKCLLN